MEGLIIAFNLFKLNIIDSPDNIYDTSFDNFCIT